MPLINVTSSIEHWVHITKPELHEIGEHINRVIDESTKYRNGKLANPHYVLAAQNEATNLNKHYNCEQNTATTNPEESNVKVGAETSETQREWLNSWQEIQKATTSNSAPTRKQRDQQTRPDDARTILNKRKQLLRPENLHRTSTERG